MYTNYSIKELLEDKENLELEIYKKLKSFQEKYECDIDIQIINIQIFGDTKERITNVILHIGY